MTVPGELEPGSNRLANPAEIETTDHPRLDRRLIVLFAMLYAVQGVVVSYFLTFNGRYMLQPSIGEDGQAIRLTMAQIGWCQTIATLPLAVKFLFGLWADKFSFLGFGHRRPYMLLGLLMQSLGLFGLTLVEPAKHVEAFTALATIAVCGLCFYDVSCDAFAVQVTPAADRGRVQGVLQASRFLSTAFFGVLFGVVWNLSAIPGQSVLWLCGLLPIPAILYTLTIAEPVHVRSAESLRLGVFRMFRHRSLWGLLIFSVIYAIVSFGVEAVLVFWFAVPALAFTERALGFQSLGRNCGRALGAIFQGRAAMLDGKRPLVMIGLCGLSAATILFSTVRGHGSAMLIGIFFGIAVGWLDALACSLAMDESDPDFPATSFALIMAFQNLGILGSGLMSTLAASVGFGSAFAIAAVVNLAGLMAWPLLVAHPRRTRTGEPWTV